MTNRNSKSIKCQNCKNSFTIEPEDFEFYDKISVPSPTFCPDCRMVRRMLFRDNLTLYKRKSDYTGEIIFSIFSQNSPVKVYERDIWWSDNWDPMNYGKEYDFSKPFFEQFKQLLLNTTVPSITLYNAVNSDYSSGVANVKNCYLVFISSDCEDSAYVSDSNKIKNSFDLTFSASSELSYESLIIDRCFKTFTSSNCEDCFEIYFSKYLVNCSNCFGCINLRNKKYCIFNKQYTKEEYYKKLKEFNIGSWQNFLNLKNETYKFFLKSIFKFTHGRYNNNVKGDYIRNSKNVAFGYYLNNVEDSKYVQLLLAPSSRDCYDCTVWGKNIELIYESIAVGDNSSNIKFCYRCYINCNNLEYSAYCHSSSNLFGCVGLRNKQYCILNKQYTKEEYEKLVPKIIEHMNNMPYIDKNGIVYKYGEFFPPELSPFGYNKTIAQEYFPLTKEQAIEKGYE